MCQEAAANVTRAVAAGGGAGHALRLAGLPRELNAVKVTVLLPLGCDGASRSTSVGHILPRHVALTITAWNWTPEGLE